MFSRAIKQLTFLHLYVGYSLIMNSCYIEAALHNNHSVISYANEHTKGHILRKICKPGYSSQLLAQLKQL